MSDESAHQDDRSAELDGLRIRQLAALRRAAYRSRSHAIIAMLLCAVACVQAVISLARHLIQSGWDWWPVLYLVVGIAGGFGAFFFATRAVALHREATKSRLQAPGTPPDFSTLGDGSQRWKNLENIDPQE